MIEQIKKLEESLKELKESYEKDKRLAYENSPHKDFSKGDIITNGKDVGIVEWTENMSCSTPYESGYMGVQIITNRRGFLAFAKRDEWDKVTDPYYLGTNKIEIELTGLEIEELKYTIGPRNFNPNKTKTKILDTLDKLKEATEL